MLEWKGAGPAGAPGDGPGRCAAVSARVRSFVETNFYVAESDTIADDSSLLDSGIVDSTGVLEIVAFLEAEFAISVADAELLPENLDSIASIARYVVAKGAA